MGRYTWGMESILKEKKGGGSRACQGAATDIGDVLRRYPWVGILAGRKLIGGGFLPSAGGFRIFAFRDGYSELHSAFYGG